MILDILTHPVTLAILLIMSIMRIKSLIKGGKTLHSIRTTVRGHIDAMSKEKTELAWEGLSYELKVKLTDPKRLKKKGKLFVGSRRVADFAAYHGRVYKGGELVVETIQRIRRVRYPRQMFVVRLRSKVTGTVRLTVWVSHVPRRDLAWGVEDVCVHPASGDLARGETLTGAPVGDPNAKPEKKEGKPQKKRRGLKREAA